MPKMCKHDPAKRCFHSTCGFIDSRGDVRVCWPHPNPMGYFMSRRLCGVGLSLLQIWASGRS